MILIVSLIVVFRYLNGDLGWRNPISTLVSYPKINYQIINLEANRPVGDFSCQPNECGTNIAKGVNKVPYPNCNPHVQINNTGAAIPGACDYWRTQQSNFGQETYINLSLISKLRKSLNKEPIVDGFLGMDDDIEIQIKAVPAFLRAEEAFNQKYGGNRKGSTYFLPSYPKGYTFTFNGSLSQKLADEPPPKNNDSLLYNGQYIIPRNHFWGVAIDLNSSTNWGNRDKANQCMIDIPPEIVSTFEASGLRWGGRFFADNHKYFDPMHFEFVPDCVDSSILNPANMSLLYIPTN